MMQTVVHLFGFPTQVLRVLGHLQTGGSHTSCVDRFTRSKEHTVILEEMDSARLAAHVTYFAATPAAVLLQLLRIVFAQFVLEGTGQSDIALNRPCFLIGSEGTEFRELIRHVLHLITVRRTHDEHIINHLFGDTVRDSHYAVRTGDSHHLGAQLNRFRGSTPCYVSEAGDSHCLILDILTCLMQQMLGEIEGTETGSFGTEDRTAPGHTFAGKHTGVILACELLVHTVKETDLTTANAYVTGRDILVGTDAAPELQHKGLAETHDLRVRFADRVKIRTTFGATHREGRQGILKGLLKTKELKHGRCHSPVETKSTFVRTDSTVELNAVTKVGLYLTLIIDPRNAEGEDTVWLDHPLHDLRLLKLGVLIIHLFNRLQYLLNRL